jgi:hypothetical protein
MIETSASTMTITRAIILKRGSIGRKLISQMINPQMSTVTRACVSTVIIEGILAALLPRATNQDARRFMQDKGKLQVGLR